MKHLDYGQKPKRNVKVAKAINRRLIGPSSVCEECRKTSAEAKLTVDHIIPCCVLSDMGFDFYHDDENFTILCSDCNKEKKGRLDFGDPRTFSLMRKYMDALEVINRRNPD